jgi:hypothetical protein
MSQTLEEQMAQAIIDIDNDSHLEAGELGEAERAAAQAPPPRKRVDRQPVGSPIQKVFKPLTPSQETFCDGIIRGLSQRAAYRAAYPDQLATDRTVTSSAAALLRNPRIVTALEDAAEESLEHLTDHGDALRRYVTKQLLIRVQTCKQEGMQLRALELLARSAGMFIQTPLIEPVAQSSEQIKRELDQHLTMLEDVSISVTLDVRRRHSLTLLMV